MVNHEYCKISLSLISQNVIDKYNLIDYQINKLLYVRVDKGMYGLFQAGINVHTAIKEHIRPLVYEPTPITSVMWHHNKNLITFTLVVGDFEIRYQIREGALNFIHSLQ